MKHLKTFESFDQPTNEVFGWSKKEKEEKFREELSKFINAYSKRMPAPTEQEIEDVVEKARKDKFEGKPGLKEEDGVKKISYRPSDDIDWRAGGHTFGSGE